MDFIRRHEPAAKEETEGLLLGFLLCSSRDTTVRSLDAETGKQLWCFPPHLEEFQTTRSSHERARSDGHTHADIGGHEKPVTALALVLAADRQERHGLLGQMVGAVDNIATNVVDAVEKVGSQSGQTRQPVVIADCGQL